eukprot:1102786-Alexandrium_andersonii.AAC.1
MSHLPKLESNAPDACVCGSSETLSCYDVDRWLDVASRAVQIRAVANLPAAPSCAASKSLGECNS